MTSRSQWAARTAVLTLSATALTGVGVGTASAATPVSPQVSAAASDCFVPPIGRPNGTVTVLLEPLIGSPYGLPGTQPLGYLPFTVTGLLDRVVDPILCELNP